MKKTLIAAAATVLTASAFAQSSVEIYGLIDLGYTSTKQTNGANTIKTKTTAAESNNSDSFIGFRGTEDLGGGLKASFVLETDFTQGFANSQRNLSLSSGLGTVTIGRFFTAMDEISGAGIGSTATNLSSLPTVAENAIGYKSPDFGGFNVGLIVAKNKRVTNGVIEPNDRGYELSANYESGPLTVQAAYISGKRAVGTLAEAAGNEFTAEDPFKLSGAAFKVAYDFGVAVPYLIYINETMKAGSVIDDNDAVVGRDARLKTKTFELGATFPMGAYTPYVTYVKGPQTLSFRGVQQGNKAKLSGYNVGVTYDMSKRTQMYAAVGSVKVKNTPVTPLKISETTVGLIHNF